MRRTGFAAGLAALTIAQPVVAGEPIRAASALPAAAQPDAGAARAASRVDDASPLIGAPLVALVVGLGTAILVVSVVALKKARSPG